jgi:hypothetical protein
MCEDSQCASVRRAIRTLGILAFSECSKRAHTDSAHWHGGGIPSVRVCGYPLG